MGYPGTLPEIYTKIEVSYHLLRKLVGVKADSTTNKVRKITKGEILMINVGSNSTGGRVEETAEVLSLS